MLTIYRTDDCVIHELDEFQEGAWINLVNPTMEESQEVAENFEIDIADIRAALDEEESSRIDLEDGYTLILVDIPTTEIRHESKNYTTIPLGIILTTENLITICTEETPILQHFIQRRVREFSTKKKMRTEIEERVGDNTEDVDLIELHELESTMVYFATSLRANGVVLERLSRYKRLEQYPEDKELLGDVIVENQQAIEMTSIYRDIINGTRELMSSVINNRLNNVMKYLTSITLVMAIPTIISGIYGMNVRSEGMPGANSPYGFAIVCGAMVVICIIALLLLKKKNML